MAGRGFGGRLPAAVLAALVLTFAAAGAGRTASPVTISMLANLNYKPAFQVLIPNFERVYPDITVNATYLPSTTLSPLEQTEFAAGNAPDIVATADGTTSAISTYKLATSGNLAPLVNKPWATRKRSLPLVTSFSKVGPVLYTMLPAVNPLGVFTNDTLFKKLGLSVPQTFSQLLTVCQKAKADGVVALGLNGGSAIGVAFVLGGLAAATVYGPDPRWTAERRAGTVTFDGSAGWHQALQEFVDMSSDGCFQPGMVSTATVDEDAEFAQGSMLMAAATSSAKGTIDADQPQFADTFHQFPGGASASQTHTALYFVMGLGVNAHSSAANQAAAQAFVDFVARPEQDELYATTTGTVTQYDFQRNQIPAYMSSFAPVFASGKYVIDPTATWWNADVLAALETDELGLVTGQVTVDGMLTAMDAAWKEGPG
jgi:raffinose/stachyose/melibiose transport system substrate-binding protein